MLSSQAIGLEISRVTWPLFSVVATTAQAQAPQRTDTGHGVVKDDWSKMLLWMRRRRRERGHGGEGNTRRGDQELPHEAVTHGFGQQQRLAVASRHVISLTELAVHGKPHCGCCHSLDACRLGIGSKVIKAQAGQSRSRFISARRPIIVGKSMCSSSGDNKHDCPRSILLRYADCLTCGAADRLTDTDRIWSMYL